MTALFAWDQDTAEGTAPGRGQRLALVLWLVVLVAASFWLNTRHNAFPYFYHPDESAKVEQVITGEWNFHHPMLLLSSVQLAGKALGVPPTEQAMVQSGRGVSAALMALAVAALALLAWLWRGWPGALAAGAALLLQHQLFELAHYMKEDSALLLGMALTFLAGFHFSRQPSGRAALLLGGACGLAISGKYIGVMALGVALPLLWQAPGGRRGAWIGGFAAAGVATFALVNLPLLTDLATFRASFDRELGLVVKGQSGTTRSVPHTQYWNIFVDNTTPAIWALVLVFLGARWRERRAVPLAEWLIIAFPFAYALALSFSPKSNDRYFLPATAIFTLLAALGVQDVARLLGAKVRASWAIGAAVVLLVGWQGPSFARYWRAFQHDDTGELLAWLRAAQEVPAEALIGRDNRVGLPDPRDADRAAAIGPIPQKVVSAKAGFAADLGSLEEMRAKGITHVAVSESNYGKFFLESLRPQAGEKEDFARRRAFYEELLRADPPIRLLFDRDRGTVLYLHPGLRVYRIAPE